VPILDNLKDVATLLGRQRQTQTAIL
jgi:hypothetical protein